MSTDSSSDTFLVRAVLLDMDGTLVDSIRIVEESWARVGVEYGIEPQKIIDFAHGRPARETFEKFLPHLSQEERDRQQRKMEKTEVGLAHLVEEVPGALEFVTELEALGVPWALVTSAPQPIAVARFEQVGLPWPEAAVTVEDVLAGKPDPEGYLSAAHQLGVNPADTVVFEDVIPGLKAGLSAGARVVAVGSVDTAPLANDVGGVEAVAQVPNFLGVAVKATEQPGVFAIRIAS